MGRTLICLPSVRLNTENYNPMMGAMLYITKYYLHYSILLYVLLASQSDAHRIAPHRDPIQSHTHPSIHI